MRHASWQAARSPQRASWHRLASDSLHRDVGAAGFLDAASPGTIPDRLAICRLISDLVRRAEEGVSWLVTEGGKTKAGRSRAVPPGYFPPKTYCAAIIAEAWKLRPWRRARADKSEGCGRRTPLLEGIVGRFVRSRAPAGSWNRAAPW